jgi:nicotinic acid phosphoribosyltransferase
MPKGNENKEKGKEKAKEKPKEKPNEESSKTQKGTWGLFGMKKNPAFDLPQTLPGLPIPPPILTDSYKATHFRQYPPAKRMVAYGEFRRAFNRRNEDQRIVCYGIRYIIQTYITRPWTIRDVENAERFFNQHNAGFNKFPFPKELFLRFIKENKGYFPVKIEALPEGTVCYPHVPIYQITAEGDYSRLATYLETMLTMVWYPSTVATSSRRVLTLVQEAFERTSDPEKHFLTSSRLQDFGFRGCTSLEQSVIGGVAHLLNFEGSDTMSACYYAQFVLNKGNPVGTSIPATEHSVMTAHLTEKQAIENMIKEFGDGLFAVVMDSYDYTAALEKVLPSVKKYKLERGGFMILRPDSGDPVSVVLQALRAAESCLGADVNKKGFKVLRGAGVIQGDGVDHDVIEKILKAAEAEHYSAENIAFGMGAGLLQNVNRDTMSFATKLNHITYLDGVERDVMKAPKTDEGKFSLPGILKVISNENGIPVVYPVQAKVKDESKNVLKVVYDKGPVKDLVWDDFTTVKNRLNEQWKSHPKQFDSLSKEMRDLIEQTRKEQLQRNEDSMRGFENASN